MARALLERPQVLRLADARELQLLGEQAPLDVLPLVAGDRQRRAAGLLQDHVRSAARGGGLPSKSREGTNMAIPWGEREVLLPHPLDRDDVPMCARTLTWTWPTVTQLLRE